VGAAPSASSEPEVQAAATRSMPTDAAMNFDTGLSGTRSDRDSIEGWRCRELVERVLDHAV
jgi:hypothetical protein